MDQYSNFSNIINQAISLNRFSVKVPHNSKNLELIKCLEINSYIRGYRVLPGGNFIEVLLKYWLGNPVFRKLLRVSKSSKRHYSKLFLKLFGTSGCFIVSTSKGLLLQRGFEFKIRRIAGGEVIFRVIE